MIVALTPHIKALCPPLHMSDATLTKPEKLFSIHSSMKFKVLAVDSSSKKVILTRKKSLMETSLPIPMSYEQVTRGLICIGMITSIKERKVIVQFHNNVHALVYIQDQQVDSYKVGQVVKVRIVFVDAENEKMRGSFNLIESHNDPQFLDSFSIGQLVNDQPFL